jgi:hypothetical protein
MIPSRDKRGHTVLRFMDTVPERLGVQVVV